MAKVRQGAVLRQIRALFDAGTIGGLADGQLHDLGEILEEELARLSEPFRAAVVLCLVEGLTHEQAGAGWGFRPESWH